jgi:hypothetical protein
LILGGDATIQISIINQGSGFWKFGLLAHLEPFSNVIFWVINIFQRFSTTSDSFAILICKYGRDLPQQQRMVSHNKSRIIIIIIKGNEDHCQDIPARDICTLESPTASGCPGHLFT